VDVDGSRAEVAAGLGVRFARPEDLTEGDRGRDLVVHTSATGAGLQLSLDLLAPEATVLDLSWYGDTRIELALGGSFHSARLGIRASQVGSVAAVRRSRYTYAQRLALAVDLLRDPAFDVLLTGESAFEDLPDVLPRLADGSLPAICHTITYRPPTDRGARCSA
jgi:threonine dehydrogenase-like Zn-dependent dehydrogenase